MRVLLLIGSLLACSRSHEQPIARPDPVDAGPRPEPAEPAELRLRTTNDPLQVVELGNPSGRFEGFATATAAGTLHVELVEGETVVTSARSPIAKDVELPIRLSFSTYSELSGIDPPGSTGAVWLHVGSEHVRRILSNLMPPLGDAGRIVTSPLESAHAEKLPVVGPQQWARLATWIFRGTDPKLPRPQWSLRVKLD